jgi:hypothetical protein
LIGFNRIFVKEDTMDGLRAAAIAREAARGQGTYFTALSEQMCWDAVAACQNRPPGQYIDQSDRRVANADELRNIPEGATIGFFTPGTLVHVMISLGNGEAAGNKNACIGVGSPIGWEILDLMLNWNGSDFGPRNLAVRFRPLV